jgi:hypothetical protein
MSFSSVRESPGSPRACQSCQERKDRFGFPGRVTADADNVLCFECFRRERIGPDAVVLTSLAATETMAPQSPFRGVELTAAQIAHRRRMFEHLASVATARA